MLTLTIDPCRQRATEISVNLLKEGHTLYYSTRCVNGQLEYKAVLNGVSGPFKAVSLESLLSAAETAGVVIPKQKKPRKTK